MKSDINYYKKICIICGKTFGKHYGTIKKPLCDRGKTDRVFTCAEDHPILNEIDDIFENTIKEVCGPEKENFQSIKSEIKKKLPKNGKYIWRTDEEDIKEEDIWST